MTDTMQSRLTLAEARRLCTRCPFNRWLGLEITEIGAGRVTMQMPWRDEIMSSPERKLVHGGVLATLVDTACGYAVSTLAGHGVPTADLMIDYHRVARPGPLIVHGKVVKSGRQISLARADIRDCEGRLVATGRCAMMSSVSTS